MITNKIMAVLAHPDDESLGFGGTLARYADEGVECYLLCATRGQHGWLGEPSQYPGEERLGQIRQQELVQAASVLNLKDVKLLDYIDGELARVNHNHIVDEITNAIQEIRPNVILTFDGYGVYGHPDHIAISQYTTSAVIQAAFAEDISPNGTHRVDALYHRVLTDDELNAYQAAFGQLSMYVDGIDRMPVSSPDWAVTTTIDTRNYVSQVWDAILKHKSQLQAHEKLSHLPLDKQQTIFARQTFYRVFNFRPISNSHEQSFFPEMGR